jgi:hypothetical protein
MSRHINWDDPTEEDLRWAIEWERWHDLQTRGYDVAELQRQFGFDASVDHDGKPFFNTSGVPGDNPAMRINPKTGLAETVQGDEDEDDDEDVELLPYSEWNANELKAELKVRGLSEHGKKAELVTRLEDDDEARAAQDPVE